MTKISDLLYGYSRAKHTFKMGLSKVYYTIIWLWIQKLWILPIIDLSCIRLYMYKYAFPAMLSCTWRCAYLVKMFARSLKITTLYICSANTQFSNELFSRIPASEFTKNLNWATHFDSWQSRSVEAKKIYLLRNLKNLQKVCKDIKKTTKTYIFHNTQ